MIDRAKIEHRDRVLRAYFEGRNWDGNQEFALTQEVVMRRQELLPDYPFVFDYEWEVEPNRSDNGKGDLIFTDAAGRFAVVEVKWIDTFNTGPTSRKKRNADRNKVRSQAADYRTFLAAKLQISGQVEGYYYTNEHPGKVFLV